MIPKRFAMVGVRRLIARAAKSNTHPTSYAAARQGLPRATVVEYGISPSTAQQVRSTQTPRLAFVGRLTAEKGCDIFLDAIAVCRRRNLDFAVDIFGDGPEREWLERHAQVLGVDDRVRFHGSGNHARVLAELPVFRALVVPSIWDEVAGIVALEAMAAGVAVIASRVGGLADIVQDVGLLVRRGDADDLANAMQRVLLDTRLASDLAAAGQRRYASRYRVDRMVSKQLAVYENAVSSSVGA
jgi:glycosyltransferase involved in cell wall biosynthesis